MSDRMITAVVAGLAWLTMAEAAHDASARAPRAKSATETCPIERLAARVVSVDGVSGSARLVRSGRPLQIHADLCILYGDTLDAGPTARVGVDTSRGVIYFSQVDEQSRATFPAPPAPGSPTLWVVLKTAYEAVFDRPHTSPDQGVSRAISACPAPRVSDVTHAEPVQVVQPISGAFVATQRLGDDAPLLLALWRPVAPDVHVILSRSDGTIIAEARACRTNSVALALTAGALRPADVLSLAIAQAGAASLNFRIEVVRARDLPRPQSPDESGALLAMWRLAEGGPDVQLDAISRIYASAPASYPAHLVLGDILAGRMP